MSKFLGPLLTETWKVPYVDLRREFKTLESDLMAAIHRVLESGAFILRDDVLQFEREVARRFGLPPVVGLNSGTDALYLAVRLAGVVAGDEVITSPHTFVATVSAIALAGASPVFADIGDDGNLDPGSAEGKITARTRAIIPVHMNGRICHMEPLLALARRHGLVVIEDAAQAIGARYKGGFAGTFGDYGCFSMHPLKLLNGAGDAGFMSVRNQDKYNQLLLLRNHGQITKERIGSFGFNSRLDNLQAAIVNVKLPHLHGRIDRRRALARRYHEALSSIEDLRLPPPPDDQGEFFDIYSSYAIRSSKRDSLVEHLTGARIEVFVMWPVPLHRQRDLGFAEVSLPQAEAISREVLSLPIFTEMSDDEQQYVIDQVRTFFAGRKR